MAVVQLLPLLLTLNFFVASISAGTNVNRQLDIPAFKEFFSQVSSQRAKDDERTKNVIGAVVSGEPEGFKLPVTTDVEVNNTSIKIQDLIPAHDSKSGAELNHVKISRTTEFRNVTGYQQTSSGLTRGGFSPSLQVKQIVSESKGQDFEFKPVFKSSSHGSILLNSPIPVGVSNKTTVLGEKPEPFRPNKPFSIQPLHLRPVLSTNHPTPSSEIHSSKTSSARAIPIQGFANTQTVPTKIVDTSGWIPISAPIQYPVTSFSSQTVTSTPSSSNALVHQTTTSNPSALTLKREEEYKTETRKNESEGQAQLGSSSGTASNETIGVVDNDSNPSFLRGISFRKPSGPLYGQVLYPSRKYPPARRPVTKPVYKAPTVSIPPTSVNQILNGGVGSYSPAQPVHYPAHHPVHQPTHQPVHHPVHHPTHQPTHQTNHQPTHQPIHQTVYQPVQQPNPPPSKGQFTPLVSSHPATVNSGHTFSENSVYGKGDGKDVANIDYPNPYPPSKNEVTNIEYSNPFTPISPVPPVYSGPGYSISPPSPVQTSFENGYGDDIGTISSFSYFRHLESEVSGPKGFDNAFSIHAGRNIAKQFSQNMFDQTGFPGNGHGAHTNKEYGTGGGKY